MDQATGVVTFNNMSNVPDLIDLESSGLVVDASNTSAFFQVAFKENVTAPKDGVMLGFWYASLEILFGSAYFDGKKIYKSDTIDLTDDLIKSETLKAQIWPSVAGPSVFGESMYVIEDVVDITRYQDSIPMIAMKQMKKYTKHAAVISGTLVTGLVAGLAADNANANANDLFDYTTLGSGYELRNGLIDMNLVDKALATNTIRAKVWEDKCGEGKCGEGKCGEEKKKEEKKEENKEEKKEVKEGTNENALKSETEKKAEEEKKAKEEKTKEAKCGEGKCGM